jgi:hypothetical protein
MPANKLVRWVVDAGICLMFVAVPDVDAWIYLFLSVAVVPDVDAGISLFLFVVAVPDMTQVFSQCNYSETLIVSS